ncbi:Protein of unknown function [Gryllus bimaculatus]|nr:Protein of unknown function [Gryllus bimaculatus]
MGTLLLECKTYGQIRALNHAAMRLRSGFCDVWNEHNIGNTAPPQSATQQSINLSSEKAIVSAGDAKSAVVRQGASEGNVKGEGTERCGLASP